MEDKPSLSQALKSNDLFAKKSLGQHFLLDLNLTTKIARLGDITKNDVIFEIGPGPGGLTQALINSPAHKIIAIEKDARFVEHLKNYFQNDLDRLEIIEGDALKISPSEILKDRGLNNFQGKIIANLPYNVGTQLFINWIEGEEFSWPMALMFQTEVAMRICAKAGDKAYGRLAILAAAKCNTSLGMHVPRLAFTPPPKVESAVALISPKNNRFDDLDALGKVTAAAFGQRRKMLRSSLAKLGDVEELCAQAGIDSSLRPETISPEAFFKLAQAYRNSL